jgi:hypothetical protein
MTTKVSVVATVNGNPIVPESEACWKASFDDPTVGAVYANIVYDLVALLLAKVGQELTIYGIDNDADRMNKAMEEVQEVLKSKPTLVG